MYSREEVYRLLESVEAEREEMLCKAGSRDELLESILELVYNDILIASKYIDCPYCRRHMELEAEEVRKVLDWIRLLGNRPHKHRLSERLKGLAVSFKIVFYVILGGLRRAGII